MGLMKIAYVVLVCTLKGRVHLEDPCMDGTAILDWIIEK